MASPFPMRPPPPTRIKKDKFTIQLPSRPPDYVPGSGPPLPPPVLQPPEDSTAYIDDRILLPPAGLAADGRPLPKRMRYIVGWRDLPAARLLVPAMDILDYVSPQTLEEWEYNMELELDVERARLVAERKALKAQAPLGIVDELPAKRHARPPLNHTNIEAAVVAELAEQSGDQGRLRGGAMSLSTPKKRKAAEFLDSYTSDESPSDQLLFDLERSKRLTDDAVSLGQEQDNRLSKVHPWPQAPVAPMVPMAPMAIDDDGRNKTLKIQPYKKQPTTNITLPLVSAPKTENPKPGRSKPRAMPFLPSKTRPREPVKPSTQAKAPASKPITEYISVTQKNSSTLRPLTQRPPKDNSSTLRPPAQRPKDNSSPQRSPAQRPRKDNSSTPRPPAQRPPKDNSSILRPPAHQPLSKVPPEAQDGKALSRQQCIKPKYRSHVARKLETPKSQARKQSPVKGKAKQPVVPMFADSSSDSDDEEEDWAVECLEDMELYDVEGRGLIRYFKVRWEGDWPPDQKSTWEPEENIPDHLVREFCRTFSDNKRQASLTSQHRLADNDAGGMVLPPLRPSVARDGGGVEQDEHEDRPSSAHSGIFVYSSDDGMEKHTWNAPNAAGYRPNLNGVFPANMA